MPNYLPHQVFSSDEFPHLVSDREERAQFKLRTLARYGLIFWQGQQPTMEPQEVEEDAYRRDDDENADLMGEDFLSISLLDGHLALSYELGGGAARLISRRPVNDGRTHLVSFFSASNFLGSIQIFEFESYHPYSSLLTHT